MILLSSSPAFLIQNFPIIIEKFDMVLGALSFFPAPNVFVLNRSTYVPLHHAVTSRTIITISVF